MMSLLSITGTFYSLAIWICSGIYKVTAYAFKIFLILSRGNLLSSDSYQQLIENFYAVLGVVMLFAIAFALLRGMINPDDQKQGTSTVKKIIVNLVTSVAILAILPTVFGFLYDIQDAVINYNTIGTFFGYGSLNQNGPQYTGPTTNPEQISDEEYSANQIVNGVWKAFFSVDPDWCDGEVEKNNPEINTDSQTARMEWCQEHIQAEEPFNLPQGDLLTYAANSNYVDLTASFGVYGGFAENASEGQIEFLWFLSLVGGVFLLYIAINYCFDMGIRLVKLVFYQVLAPIPIFMRIVPYGKISSTFNQWLKITLTCYLEVFVRIFIFYFVIYICTTIKNSEVLSLTLDNFGFFTKMFTYAFLYMGIFAFMKKSPKLLSEITGIDSGNMKLGLKEKLSEGGGFMAGALVGGGITAGIRGATSAWERGEDGKLHHKPGTVGIRSAVAGLVSGAVRGGKAGWSAKNFKDMKSAASSGAKGAVEAREKRSNYKAAHGGTLDGAIAGHVTDFVKKATNYVTDNSIEGLTRKSQNMGNIVSSYNTFNDTVEQLLEKEQAKGGGSVFLKEGFQSIIGQEYHDFDEKAKKLAELRARFNSGDTSVTADMLRTAEGNYTDARDAVRNKLMNIGLEGSDGKDYKSLTAKGKAVLKDTMVNAQSLQATILANADSEPVQQIMGENGNKALSDMINGKPLTVESFEFGNNKLKDVAKVEQSKADIKAAEMQKENAAKGDKK